MTEVEEIVHRVQKLSKDDFAHFKQLVQDIDNDYWDQQIATDFRQGKFEQLIKKARQEFAEGKARAL
uniref:Uncharacterized protein n=1 Tax=Chlorobium chlorochromatii (strain CaD3) TaxID=340177 RepID=Q3APP8_CHLCH